MAKGIMQSDGTMCWSGASCRKHAGAVFKDAAGNASTREGLQRLVDDALKNEEFEVYVAERENLERIEHDLSVMEEPDIPVDNLMLPSGFVHDQGEWSKFLLNSRDEGLYPSCLNRVGNGNVNDFAPNVVAGSVEEDRILDVYAASATEIGLKNFDTTMHEQHSHGESFLFTGDKGGSVTVSLPKLTRVKKNAAAAHAKWRSEINKHIEFNAGTLGRYPTDEQKRVAINGFLDDVQVDRTRVKERFVKARFEMLYAKKSWSHESVGYEKVGKDMTERLIAVQRLHDEVYFNRLKARELKALLK